MSRSEYAKMYTENMMRALCKNGSEVIKRCTRNYQVGLGMCLAAGVIYLNRDVISARTRDYCSMLCERYSHQPELPSDVVRDAFTSTTIDPPMLIEGHTHPSAAGCRTSATNYSKKLSMLMGAGLYVVGMSRSDQRKQLIGSRCWYWVKDVNSSNCNHAKTPSDLLYICDVDYYMDMPQFLATNFNPVILYTVVPNRATSTGEDNTSFHFEDDNTLVTNVSGGGKYQHHLWNYSCDSVLVTNTIFGIPISATAFSIERKQVANHRQLILFSPMRKFYGLFALIASYILESKNIKRFLPVVTTPDSKRYVRFQVTNETGEIMVTTARPGAQLSAYMPQTVDDSISTVARLGKQDLTIPTTASWIPDKEASAVATEYHRSLRGEMMLSEMMVFPVDKSVRAYQFEPKNYDPDAQAKIQAFMSPFIHGAYACINNSASERQCVEGRIINLRKPEPKPCNFRDTCIGEFAKLVVPDGVNLHPYDCEYIADKQTRPAQKQSLLKAYVSGPIRKFVVKCFIKSETYNGPKDPRNITVFNDSFKLEMSGYTLSMSEYCKKFDWYGPGKTPDKLAERVTSICLNANSVNISDYHRMDGTITHVIRMVERAIMMRAFSHNRARLNELFRESVNNKAYLPNETQFDQLSSQGSGNPDTSLVQTLRSSFNSYLAYRKTGLHPQEAFNKLGIHLGDDGLDPELPEEAHNWASKATGLVLEASTIIRGFRGVTFLARYYSPNVWTGDTNSMCDLKRQLSKFHTTVRLPNNITPEQKLVEKAMSFVSTDASTPILGPYCKRVLSLSKFRPISKLGVGNWWSKFDDSVQYPNVDVNGWMEDEVRVQLPEFAFDQFNDWLESCKTIEELLSPKLFHPIETPRSIPASVVVDDQIYTIEKEITETTTTSTQAGDIPNIRSEDIPTEVKVFRGPDGTTTSHRVIAIDKSTAKGPQERTAKFKKKNDQTVKNDRKTTKAAHK